MQESSIDEAVLQSIADATGGRYYRAEDSAVLRQVYDEISSARAVGGGGRKPSPTCAN